MTLTFELQFNVGRAWGTKHCAFMCLRAQEESPKKVIFDLKPEHEVKEEGWGMVQSQTLSCLLCTSDAADDPRVV